MIQLKYILFTLALLSIICCSADDGNDSLELADISIEFENDCISPANGWQTIASPGQISYQNVDRRYALNDYDLYFRLHYKTNLKNNYHLISHTFSNMTINNSDTFIFEMRAIMDSIEYTNIELYNKFKFIYDELSIITLSEISHDTIHPQNCFNRRSMSNLYFTIDGNLISEEGHLLSVENVRLEGAWNHWRN